VTVRALLPSSPEYAVYTAALAVLAVGLNPACHRFDPPVDPALARADVEKLWGTLPEQRVALGEAWERWGSE
jgi:hypothetical protein